MSLKAAPTQPVAFPGIGTSVSQAHFTPFLACKKQKAGVAPPLFGVGLLLGVASYLALFNLQLQALSPLLAWLLLQAQARLLPFLCLSSLVWLQPLALPL